MKYGPEDCFAEGKGLRWLFGNIRRKLMLFVAVILLIVVGLFWFFTTHLLQPAYQRAITMDLDTVLAQVVKVIDDVENAGGPVLVGKPLANGLVEVRLSDECIALLDTAIRDGEINLSNRCLDISEVSLQNLLLVDNLAPRCVLHPTHEIGLNAEGLVESESERNGEAITLVRRAVFEAGGAFRQVQNGAIILGATAASGKLAVVLSANLERIPQAVGVLRSLLLPLSLLLALFSTAAAWIFSRWFTRPLSRLSAAAREMAKGNYEVRVEDCGDDEIGELGRDFNRMAQEVNRSAKLQRDILANVSHDLRTPLTLIKGYAETVRDLTGDQPEKRADQLNVIVDESDRLSALVGSVMELSRMSSGTERPEPVRFDLFDLCDELAYRYEELARKKGYTFFFSGEEGCIIYADPALTERALHNLLGNAIAHVGEDGFIGLKVSVTPAGMVRCEVSDHGQGILSKDLPHIFDRYYRARADAGKPGTGLGLSITKAIFSAQNMPYGVMTEIGKGSTFWFESPRQG